MAGIVTKYGWGDLVCQREIYPVDALFTGMVDTYDDKSNNELLVRFLGQWESKSPISFLNFILSQDLLGLAQLQDWQLIF